MTPPDEKPRCAFVSKQHPCGLFEDHPIHVWGNTYPVHHYFTPSPVAAEAEDAKLPTIRIIASSDVPPDQLAFVNDAGKIVGKIVNVASAAKTQGPCAYCHGPHATNKHPDDAKGFMAGLAPDERAKHYASDHVVVGPTTAQTQKPWKVYALGFGDPWQTTFCYGRAGSAGVILFEFDEEWRARGLATALQEVVNPDPKAGATATAEGDFRNVAAHEAHELVVRQMGVKHNHDCTIGTYCITALENAVTNLCMEARRWTNAPVPPAAGQSGERVEKLLADYCEAWGQEDDGETGPVAWLRERITALLSAPEAGKEERKD